MKILIIHAHIANRGDEAAVRAMVDELLQYDSTLNIKILYNGSTPYPNMNRVSMETDRFPKSKSIVERIGFMIAYLTCGHVALTKRTNEFLKDVKTADLVLHAPGGPSIGDVYLHVEKLYLLKLDLIRKMKKPYMFYAPSMGPFRIESRNMLRKIILQSAKKIVLRDPISLNYVKELIPNKEVSLALDSALQHDINMVENFKKLEGYEALKSFLAEHDRVIGVTITDLKWHPKHKLTTEIDAIKPVFQEFIDKKLAQNYAVLFIPQLYGVGDDTTLMSEFMREEHTFIMEAESEVYDAYFQQYVIGQLHAVVGMRYHSNIFSAKMGTPFVSVAYEQKMSGFMESMELQEYCIPLSKLSVALLEEKFDLLQSQYLDYKQNLITQHTAMQENSYKSTQAVLDILAEI